eukprot:6175692-Pleurochrysis_carterae.AAC.3
MVKFDSRACRDQTALKDGAGVELERKATGATPPVLRGGWTIVKMILVLLQMLKGSNVAGRAHSHHSE